MPRWRSKTPSRSRRTPSRPSRSSAARARPCGTSTAAPYLDFYGGHCVALLGHCPPRVVAAVQEQAETLMFYSNAMYSPVRAARGARRSPRSRPRASATPSSATRAPRPTRPRSSSPATYTGRPGVVAMHGGFHGRTLGALAATSGDRLPRAVPATSCPRRASCRSAGTGAVEEALAAGRRRGRHRRADPEHGRRDRGPGRLLPRPAPPVRRGRDAS